MSSRTLKTWLAAALALAAAAAFTSPAPAAILYTNNYNSEQLASFTIGADGLLAPVAGSPFQFADPTEGFSITPDGGFLVESFGFDSKAGSFALSPGGGITEAQAPIGPGGFGVPAITPHGQFAYIYSSPSGVIAYRLGPGGSMTKVGGPFGSALGSIPAITADGRFLFVPSYVDGTIERFAIQPSGSLESLGTTPIGTEGPTDMRVTPDGRFAILLVDPSGSGDLRSFAIGADGSLTEVGTPVATTGAVSGPPVISPNGRFVYKTDGNEESITAYSIGANGALSQLGPPTPTGLSQPQGIGMSNDGRFLYVEPQSGEKIQAFSVAADGTLTKIGTPTPTGGFSDGVTLLPLPAVPSAKLATPAPVAPGKKATFDAGASSDVGSALNGYSWNFGDGSTANGGAKIDHAFKKAGVYTVTVTAHDEAGCNGFVFTGQSAYCNGRNAQASVTLDTLPVIQSLRLQLPPTKRPRHHAKASNRPARPKGIGTFNYRLSENARVTFVIQRKRPGRMVGKSCRSKTKRNAKKRKCLLLRNRGSLSVDAQQGPNRSTLPKRLGGKPMKPGAYRATAVAVDSAGGQSKPKSIDFAFGVNKRRPH
ncbi:MAG TPA: PKD domain-containing protein [Solirubrobacterales bacterium]|nr:PKD domain-containing protein [Solirubrobacterales bacterium]